MKTLNRYMNGDRLYLGCHRGDRKNCPENTMSAFRAAVNLGLDAIETDVRMTADGVLVLIHDRDVERTTNGKGFVDEMTLAEIKALDAGFWKDEKFTGEQIPTVEEFLELVSKTDIFVNWELKEYPLELSDRAYELIDKLVEMLDRYEMSERSMMNSFSEKNLEYIYDKWGDKFVTHGYIHYKNPKDFADKPLESFINWAAMWRKDEAHISSFDEDYKYAIDRDILCCILVPDLEEHYRRALDMGCRYFTSDDPTTAVRILRELGVRA